jgi:hypothetical protein
LLVCTVSANLPINLKFKIHYLTTFLSDQNSGGNDGCTVNIEMTVFQNISADLNTEIGQT